MTFGTVHTAEPVSARREVEEWAEELLADQIETWFSRKRMKLSCKARPATRDECLDQSRATRIGRERDSSYWNQLTNPNPER
jgi:hypothetical protein